MLDLRHHNHPARRVSRLFKREFPWLSYDDLLQEAFVLAIRAERDYRPSICPEDAFIYVCVSNGIKRYVRNACRARLARSPLEYSERHPGWELDPFTHTWRGQVLEHVYNVLCDKYNIHSVVPILAGLHSSDEVAKDLSISRKSVYASTRRAKRRLLSDPILARMWKDLSI